MAKNTGLGRGLDAIFMDNSSTDNDSVIMLRTSEIEPNPDQPRRSFDEEALAQLADSISVHGLIQPIIVRQSATDGIYEIVAGERRWRAARLIGLTEVPVIVKELDDRKASEIALIENIQREDLNPVEEAVAFRSLIRDYDMTQEELGRRVGKSRSTVTNSLRLLDLPDGVIEMLSDGRLTAGHARSLLALKRPEQIMEAANTAVSQKMSVREVELYVKRLNRAPDVPPPVAVETPDKPQVDYAGELARRMTRRLGRHVTITANTRVKKVEVEFNDNDELEQIARRLCGENILDD